MVQTKGIKFNDFYIPPFTVKQGEIVVLQLPNGPYFQGILFNLVDLLTAKKKDESVDLKDEFRFAAHINENRWQGLFAPLTIERYIKKFGNPDNNVPERIYELEGIKHNTKISSLAGNPRKQLSLLTTFSWTNNVVFDLGGVDPIGAKQAYNLVKSQIKKSGAAILIDTYDEFRNECSRFVKFVLVPSSD